MRNKIWDVISPVVFLLLGEVLITAICLMIGSAVFRISLEDVEYLNYTNFPTIVNIIWFAAMLFLVRPYYRADRVRFSCAEEKMSAGRSFLWGAVCAAAAIGWNFFLTGVLGLATDSEEIYGYNQNPALLILSTCVLGPIVEEVVFRGMVYRRARLYAGVWPAILISAALFGVYHLNLAQGIYAAGFGIVLAYYYECTGRLEACIAVHAAANLAALLFGVFT